MPTKSHESKEIEQKAPHLKIQARQANSQQTNPQEAFARVSSLPTSLLMPANIMALQRTVGNRAVQRMLVEGGHYRDQEVKNRDNMPAAPLAEEESQKEQPLVIPEEFTPIGYTERPDEYGTELVSVDSGERRTEGAPAVAAPPVGFHDLGRTGAARFGDEYGLDDLYPHAFTNGGMTGTVVWGGGGGAGAHGNEAAGSIQAQVAPVF